MSDESNDAELRQKLTQLGVDVGPITKSTRPLYQRMLRKRANELEASSVGSAAKKQKLDPAPSLRTPRAARSRPAPAKPRSALKSEPKRAQKLHKSRASAVPTPVGGASRSGTPAVHFNPPPRRNFSSGTPPGPGRIFEQPERPEAPAPHFPRAPNIYPPLPRPFPSPQYSPPSSPFSSSSASSSSSQPPRRNSSDPPATPLSPSPPYSPPSPSSPGSTDTSGGVVNTITNWLGARVKKIIGHLQDVASPTPRSPLRRTPSAASLSPSSPSKQLSQQQQQQQQQQVSRDSVCIDEIDFSEKAGGSNEVYLHMPSPQDRSSGGSAGVRPSFSPSRGSSSGASEKYDWELLPGDVQICKKHDGQLWLLGRGGCGQVYRGLKDKVDSVAVKVIRLQGCVGNPRSAMTQFKQEIDMISKLRHRHILQFYGACIQPSCLYMVTELMDTDLFSALRQGPEYSWSGEHGREVLAGIASGLHHLHSRRPPVVHRDIKSPNILVMNGLAKIADVGIANTMAATDMTAQRGFTIAWAAPEVILRKRANEKIDIWSFGIILWEVVTGSMPRPGQLVFPSQAPMHLRSLYMQCTSDSSGNRPSAADIIQTLKAP